MSAKRAATLKPTDEDGLLMTLGKIVVEFARLEHDYLSWSIGYLLGVKEQPGWIITTKLSFKEKVDVLDALVRDRDLALAQDTEYEAFVRRLGQIEEQRNTLMHSSWHWIVQGDIAGNVRLQRHILTKPTVKRKRGLHLSSQDITKAQLNKFVEELEAAQATLWDYLDRWEKLPA